MKKVYCKDCKYYAYLIEQNAGNYLNDMCVSPQNYTDTYYEPKKHRSMPSTLNAYNDCKFYQKKEA